MIKQFHSWAYIQRKSYIKKIHAPQCLALFTIAKTWKQSKCPSTDKWIKMWYIYIIEYYSAININKIMLFAATQKDLEIIILSEVSQTEKNKHHMVSLICGI